MHNLVIIGAGPAGLTCAIYAGRSRLKTVILEKMVVGGRILMTESIENFPGFVPSITTQELIGNMEKQVKNLGLDVAFEEAIDLEPDTMEVKTTENSYKSQAIIIATGGHARRLGVGGENEFVGKGVSYCATCDGPLYKDKKVILIGAGNTAAEEALYLARIAKSVTIVHRRNELRAAHILQDRLKENKKISFLLNSIVTEVKGHTKVSAVVIRDVNTAKEQTLECDGIFIYVGIEPNTAFLKGKLNMDEKGFIITDEDLKTSKEGIFACGDCRRKSLYQMITACGDGATAAESVNKYLMNMI